MQRRKFLVGMGSLAAGGAATMGTGAISFQESNRSLDVKIEDDVNAFLHLRPGQENGEYALGVDEGTYSDQLEIDLNGQSQTAGSGVNTDSVFFADDVFRMRNDATQTLYISAVIGSNGFLKSGDVRAYVYTREARSRPLDSGNVVELPVGSVENFGIHIDTTGVDSAQGLTGEDDRLLIRADEDPGSNNVL